MMVRFMGNGVRIMHIILSLCSDCGMYIYHVSSKTGVHVDSVHDIAHFMMEHGYRDIFYLELERKGEI
mgnify:CR=1 FL=1